MLVGHHWPLTTLLPTSMVERCARQPMLHVQRRHDRTVHAIRVGNVVVQHVAIYHELCTAKDAKEAAEELQGGCHGEALFVRSFNSNEACEELCHAHALRRHCIAELASVMFDGHGLALSHMRSTGRGQMQCVIGRRTVG